MGSKNMVEKGADVAKKGADMAKKWADVVRADVAGAEVSWKHYFRKNNIDFLKNLKA